MLQKKILSQIVSQGRKITSAKAHEDDDALGYLKLLPGTWKNVPNLIGRGWNMIALPFIDPNGGNLNYRLLVNQYNEQLKFTTIDKGVPNRGIEKQNGKLVNADQFVVTLDYEQEIEQMFADDFPQSGLAGGKGLAIHHEPGLFLQMANKVSEDLEVARLASIPHGNSVLALGKASIYEGAPRIPDENGLPIGVPQKLNSPYLAPYKHFNDNPFRGVFNPVSPNDLLKEANSNVKILRTTEFKFDTKFGTGGIHNIPFIEKQADASEMTAHFWIQELAEKDKNGQPKLRLQYTQTVMLDFFDNGKGEIIKWPHVSINTMEKVVD
jgi:hypothetical protein